MKISSITNKMIYIVEVFVLAVGLTACGGLMNHGGMDHSTHMDHGDAVSQVETGVEVVYESLLIKDSWGRPSLEGEHAAAFMILMNKGEEDDRLTHVEAEIANAVELHESKIENDIMSMQQVEGVDIPAGGQAQLKSGGYHIMLIGLTKDLTEGESYPLTLHFEKSGKVEVEVQVHQP